MKGPIYRALIVSGGEVPVTKLAALQKVLQSDFLNSVREVYEHVYETVDVQVIVKISSEQFHLPIENDIT